MSEATAYFVVFEFLRRTIIFVSPARFSMNFIPDYNFFSVWFAAMLKAPIKNVFIGSTFENSSLQRLVIYVEKSTAAPIELRAKICVKISAKGALVEFADLRKFSDLFSMTQQREPTGRFNVEWRQSHDHTEAQVKRHHLIFSFRARPKMSPDGFSP